VFGEIRRRPRKPCRPGVAGLFCFAGTVLAGLLTPAHSRAAGGHHAVDDAAILDPGQCQLEAWAEQASDHRLQHLGQACRASGVEIGWNLDRSVDHAEPIARSMGLQLKWARDLQPGLGLGLGAVWAAGWQNGSPRFAGQTLLVPLSWSPRDDLVLHLNVGRDFRQDAPDVARQGVALEWHPAAPWQALVEWWRDALGPQRRVGLRYIVDDRVSVDLSRAQALDASRGAWWTLGLNWTLGR